MSFSIDNSKENYSDPEKIITNNTGESVNSTNDTEKPGEENYYIEQEDNKEIEGEVVENNENVGAGVENSNSTKSKKSLKDKISGFFSSAAKKTKKTYKKLEEKVSELHIKEKLKQTGEKTVSIAKNTGKYIATKATQAKVSLGLL
jgi:hypothetical protein